MKNKTTNLHILKCMHIQSNVHRVGETKLIKGICRLSFFKDNFNWKTWK